MLTEQTMQAEDRRPVESALRRIDELSARLEGTIDLVSKRIDPVVFHGPDLIDKDEMARPRAASSDLTMRLHAVGDSLERQLARLTALHDGIEL